MVPTTAHFDTQVIHAQEQRTQQKGIHVSVGSTLTQGNITSLQKIDLSSEPKQLPWKQICQQLGDENRTKRMLGSCSGLRVCASGQCGTSW